MSLLLCIHFKLYFKMCWVLVLVISAHLFRRCLFDNTFWALYMQKPNLMFILGKLRLPKSKISALTVFTMTYSYTQHCFHLLYHNLLKHVSISTTSLLLSKMDNTIIINMNLIHSVLHNAICEGKGFLLVTEEEEKVVIIL